MRVKETANTTKYWISADETYAWAHKTGARWPCSTLSGKRIFAEYDDNGRLCDVAIDGRSDNGRLCDVAIDGQSDTDTSSHEFNCLMKDFRNARDKRRGI
jgi:hypothetical protein